MIAGGRAAPSAVVAAVVAVAWPSLLLTAAAGRHAHDRARRAPLRRRDGRLPGSPTPTTGDSHVRRRRRRRGLRLQRRRPPDLYLAGGSNPAALYRNDSPVGGALAVHAPRRSRDRPHRRHGRLPDRHRRRRATWTSRCSGSGETVLLRGLGGCRFERANEALVVRRRDRLDDGVQRDLGGRASAADPRDRARTSGSTRRGKPTSTAPTTPCCGRTPAGTGYAAPIPLAPGYCTLSMLFSDWDRSGRRDLRVTNDRQLLHRRRRTSSGGSRRARRRGSTRTRTAGSRCRSGAWASPATT